MNPENYEAWFRTPWGRRADRTEGRLVAKAARFGPGTRILDIGCGTAHFTGGFSRRGAAVFGLDLSREMLAYARSRRPGFKAVVGDARTLPFKAGAFDVAVFITVLEFVPDPRSALEEAGRVLGPSGRAWVGYLNRWSPWGLLRKIRGLLGNAAWRKARFFGRREMRGLLARSGFAVGRARSVLCGSFVLIEAEKKPLTAP